LAACASDTPEGLLVEPPFEDGKADVGDRVTDMGPLAFGESGAAAAQIVEDLEFHGYTLAVRDGARVSLEVTQRGSSRSLDSTLFVYGPRSDDGYGASALAHDDDSGWGRLSRVRGLSLARGGSYLVVVGTHDARGRGRYRLEARCESGECDPLPAPPPPPEPGDGTCHPAIAAAIRACVDGWLADPDGAGSNRFDLVAQCADVEPVAPAWDTLCASRDAPPALCAMSLEELARDYLPACRREAYDAVLDDTCVLGDRYRDLFAPGPLVLIARDDLTAGTSLGELERQQIVAAVRTTAHDDVTTADDAFAAVDDGVVHRAELWDSSNRRAFTAYEVGAGDNSFGMIFEHGTTTPAASIHDGDLEGCAVRWGREMRECGSDADCAEGLRCHGVAEEIRKGRCVDYRAPRHPAEESSCAAQSDCPAGSGLVCGGASSWGEGLCRPAWLTGSFETRPSQGIPDGSAAGAEVTLVAFGLATVDVDVTIDLHIVHARPRDLRVTLINPAGAEVVVIDGTGAGAEVLLEDVAVRGFSGDEQVNGVWRLRVVDRVSGRTGTVERFGLTITSRWD
ncbi:MAG: proprotein convertase P-domain-containing protein, partial [Deltaproteobacteria bacterium]|nr:proprotein convertase P-domain-containing protein [Deltaproteobacteria bacterium]